MSVSTSTGNVTLIGKAPSAATRLGEALHFRSDGWLPLPEWSRFFIGLGSALSVQDSGGHHSIAAVVAPTRAFAAAFAGVGAVIGRASLVSQDTVAHNVMLHSLAPGASVTYLDAHSRSRIGRLSGWCERDRERYARVEVGGRMAILVPENRWIYIEPSNKDTERLPRSARGRLVQANAGLVATVLDEEAIADFLACSRLDCLIVGIENKLRDEIQETPFAALVRENSILEGTLQDLVRVRAFTRDGDSYHSEVVSPRRVRSIGKHDLVPLVIFDGASSFLELSAAWPEASWIVILDRTEHRFADAVLELDRCFATRRVDWSIPADIPKMPKGLECVVMELATR